VFYARGSIMAVPFDVRTLATGAPVPMLDNVAVASAGGIAHFDVSSTGTLAYVTGYLAADGLRTPMWIDRQGRETPLGAEPRNYLYLRISPDQSRVALDVAGENRDIYVWDIGQRATKRLTTDPVLDRAPIFTRDSRRIIFSSDRNGLPSLFWQSADGVGGAQRLTESDDAHYSMSAAPDGILVRVTPGGAGGGAADIYLMSMEQDHKLTPIITEEFVEQNAEVSHNGRWMAYQTGRSGRDEILVRPYPANDAEFSVSTAGGTEPLWSTDDSELFYRSPTGGIMRVVVKPGTTWVAGAPEQVLPGEGLRVGSQGANPFRTYDVSADGRRFLVLKNVPSSENATSAPTIIVVQNWLEELKRRVPLK
jgi:Tol biopolymer transport system component